MLKQTTFQRILFTNKQTTFPGIFLYRSSTKGGARPVNPVAQKIMDRYKKDGQVAPSGEDVQWRTYMRSVNEAALCLQEEIIANPVCALNIFYSFENFPHKHLTYSYHFFEVPIRVQ